MNYKDEIAKARYLISATFGELVFKEDTHQYFLPQPDGSMKEYSCVSNYTKQWDQTDFKKIAETYVKNHPEEKDSDGNPITPESVRAEWRKRGDDACELGTQVHEFAESLGWLSNNEAEKICLSAKPQYNPMTNQLEPLAGYDKLSLKERAAKKFWDDMATAPQFKDLHFVMAETKVYTSVGPYSEQYNNNYAGTFDLLLYYDDPNGVNSGFVIGDYKGLPLDTPIPTENGFVDMGDLKEGMKVFDKFGKLCTILHCSGIHHNPCYRIVFDNNDEIVADIDHRWLIDDTKVLTTKELRPGDRILDPLPISGILSEDFSAVVKKKSGECREIVSVTPVETVPTRCIEVDSPSHTYLCTKNFIVTHNTNKELVKPFVRKKGQTLAYPFEDIFEEPQGHYTLQLSCYQIPLEAIGLKVIGRRLIHLTDKGEYKLIPLPDVTDRIKDSLRGPYISPEELGRED